MSDSPRLVTTLGLPRRVALALLREGLFSVAQLQRVGHNRIKSRVGTVGLRLIKQQLKKAGIDLPAPRSLGRKAPNRQLEIESLYLAGETLQSIGETFHISRERVRQIINKSFPPESLQQAKQQHYQNYIAPHEGAVRYLMGIA